MISNIFIIILTVHRINHGHDLVILFPRYQSSDRVPHFIGLLRLVFLSLFRQLFKLSLRNQDICSLSSLRLLFLLLALLFSFFRGRWRRCDYFFCQFYQTIFSLAFQLFIFIIDHSQVVGQSLNFLGFLGVD